jgi:hypothetical protein
MGVQLFFQVLSDEISRMASLKKDLDYGLPLGKSVILDSSTEVQDWLQRKLGEMQSFLKSLNVLIKTALPKALGAPGEPSDIDGIIYVAKRLTEVYQSILEWTVEFRNVEAKGEFNRLPELIAQISRNLIKEIEAFPVNSNRQINDALRRYEKTKQLQSLDLILNLTLPDTTELEEELRRLKGN